ncbi:myomegalin-like isoform X1 [Pongo abelii]|uniref:myomegalin-like isoform X1 n=1 Tax=Pongo abelii TaxID=9601 RepID=UPI003005BF38
MGVTSDCPDPCLGPFHSWITSPSLVTLGLNQRLAHQGPPSTCAPSCHSANNAIKIFRRSCCYQKPLSLLRLTSWRNTELYLVAGESLVKQDSKQVQVDLQDLGYETCGRSKNEAEREETTSPECEEHNSPKEMVLMEGLCSEQGCRGSTLASSSERKPLENQLGKQEEFCVYGKSENISVL